MWATLALLATTSLPVAQAPDLKLTDVHVTHGMLGPIRSDSKILPGDALYVRFTIEGIVIDAQGKSLYSTAVKVTNSENRVIFQQEPQDLETHNALGGNQMPGFAHLDIGLSQDPGKYKLEVTVKDRSAGKEQSLEYPFEVADPGFGLVRVTTSSDPDALNQSAVFETGSALWINGAIVGFARDSKTKQPKITVGVKILDQAGKKTVFEARRARADEDVPEDAKALTGRFVLSLNRPGKFVFELSAVDETSGKSSLVRFPLQVISVPTGE